MRTKKLNILFICKYNRFRSKVAESYFKKISNRFSVRSRGVIQGNMNRNKKEVLLPKEFGLNIKSKPVGVKYDDLKWADYVIIAANNVPKEMLRSHRIKNKIIQWDIEDVYPNSSEEKVREIIKKVMKKVDDFKRRF